MDDQTAAIAFLADAKSYGLKGKRVERIDTHASCVFLAGDRAFKLKRAVAYSYLDYSTIERREAACRAELALNRRTAPQLYLDVRALRRRPDGALGFDGAGATVDWVIEMRRFDAAGLFNRMAAAKRLTPGLMRELADVIAAFHAAAEPGGQAGGSAGIAWVIDENNVNLRASGMFAADVVAALDDASRAALRRHAELLDARRQHDKVRRCHGDLHLGNICLVDGRPTLFDAVEFSDAIATIDVVYDLAFLLMDLQHRGLGALANLVFNRYLDLSRESDALPALPLFLSLRAAIRAHVSAAAAANQVEPVRTETHKAARDYLGLSLALLAPARPRLIAIGGRSGSGKSTFAQAVAGEFPPAPGARVIRSDVLRKALLDLPPETRLPAGAYSHAMARQVYARLLHEAAAALAAGYSAILDATFLDAAERAGAATIAANAGAAFTGIWLEAPARVMAARLAARQGDASDATPAVLEQQLGQDPGPLDWRRVSTSGPYRRVLATLRQALGLEAPLTSR